MKFSIKDFFSKCDQICRFLRIWSHLLKKSLMDQWILNGSSVQLLLTRKKDSVRATPRSCKWHKVFKNGPSKNCRRQPLRNLKGTEDPLRIHSSIKDFFSKCDWICRKLQIWSHLLKKSLMENFIFFLQCWLHNHGTLL